MFKNKNTMAGVFTTLTLVSLLISSCTSSQTSTPTRVPTRTPTATPVPLPALSLEPGEFYFSLDGQPGFLFSRNVAGYEQTHYETFLDWTRTGGSKIARIQLDSLGGMGYTSSGEVDEAWSNQWDRIFDYAEADGIYILPVFSGWFDWNAGEGFSTWASNPLNVANGGPVQSPAELFDPGSPTQTLWLAWMETLVERWQDRENIAAWEIFSEVNLASGVTEASGVDFVNRAAALIRAADLSHRPVTASITDTELWPIFYRDTAIDFINIHPYPISAQLDRVIISGVRPLLALYNRPVLIGESGLSADAPDSSTGGATVAENAPVGFRHAIWAAIVSGAMNGRALYWEDSYGIYFSNLGIPWMEQYKTYELPAANFVRDVDFTGFKPLTSTSTPVVWGAAVGNESLVLGWFRDVDCEPLDWIIQTVPAGQTVTLTIPGTAANWQVDFYDTQDGTTIISSTTVIRYGSTVTVTLPEFQDDIAFKMMAEAGTSVITPEKEMTPTTPMIFHNTDPIAGTWSGTFMGASGSFSAQIEISIQPACVIGDVCGTFNVPIIPCSGDLLLQNIDGGTFVFIEQNVTGATTCIPSGYEYLQPLTDGTLSYQFFFIPGSADKSSGVLIRR